MTMLNDVWTLGEFKADTQEHIRRLTETGEAEVLTVEGKPALVVQSAGAYQKLLEEAEFARHIVALKKSIAEADRGELIPADEFFEQMAREEGIEIDP